MSTHYKNLPSDLISQTEAASLRGVTRQAISKLVKKGRLKSYEIAGRKLVRKADVLTYEMGQPGRPKANSKKKSGRTAPRRTASRK